MDAAAAVASILASIVATVAGDEVWAPAVYWRQTGRKKGAYKIELDVFRNHEVSSKGNVRDAETKKLLSTYLRKGRRNVNLQMDKKRYACVVARLMASSFLGKPATPDLTADHIDIDETNDVINNLRWATQEQQALNRKKHEATARKIPVIAKKLKTGEEIPFESVEKAAGELDLNVQSVSEVLHGKRESTGGFSFTIREPAPIPGQVFREYQNSKVFIGNEGYVRDERSGIVITRLISNYSENDDYPVIHIDGAPLKLHVLVAHLFVQKPPEYTDSFIAHHIDHNKRNAVASNLAWITKSDNTSLAHDAGRFDNSKSKRKAIAIEGEPFKSITAAADTKRFGSRRTIQRRLDDITNTSYVYRD